MGDLIQFYPRPLTSLPSERLRLQRMIATARAQYQAIFPDDLTMNRAIIQSSELLYEIEDTAPCECNPENLG